MQSILEVAHFFNDLSLYNFDELAAKDCKDISFKIELLEQTLEKDIEELKRLSDKHLHLAVHKLSYHNTK